MGEVWRVSLRCPALGIGHSEPEDRTTSARLVGDYVVG